MTGADIVGKLFYVFFLAAMAAGAVLYYSQDSGLKDSFKPLFLVLLGFSMAALVFDGVIQGRIRAKRRYVTREDHPISFWLIVGVYMFAAAALLTASVWFLASPQA